MDASRQPTRDPAPVTASTSTSTGFRTLLDQVRLGVADAREELCRRYYTRVERMVHQSLTRRVMPAKPWLAAILSTRDLAQDVFQRVLGEVATFAGHDEEAFVAYLAKAVRNRLVDALRFHEAVRRDRRMHQDGREADDVAARERGPGTQAVRAEDLRRLTEALGSLTEREVVLLRERLDNDSGYREIAAMLGFPSADAARKAFYAVQARLLVKLRGMGFGRDA